MKTKEQLFSELRAVMVAEFNLAPEAVTLDADLYDDLEFDSLDAIDLMHGVERIIDRKLTASEFIEARTVRGAIDEIHALQREAA